MALVVEGLKYSYNGLLVLDNLNLVFPASTFTCITGPSGCGKSTFLKVVAGLLNNNQGKVMLSGQPLDCSKGEIGFFFQENALFPWHTILKNVEFGLKLKGETKKSIQEKSHYYLELVGLQDCIDFYPHQLSGGMKQRAALARVLAYEPKLLLMDEPFASLDAQTRNLLQVELMKIWQKEQKTVLFVTHSIDEAVFLADQILVLTKKPAQIKQLVKIKLNRPRKRTADDFIKVREHLLNILNQDSIGEVTNAQVGNC